MMAPNLSACPNEVIESIVVLLDLSSICNLRLSSQILAAKATQDHFKSYFHSKHVNITGSELRAFVDITRRGRLGCYVKNVVLFGVVNNTMLLESILREAQYECEEEAQEDEDREKNGVEDDGENYEPRTRRQIKAAQDLKILQQRRTDDEQLNQSGEYVSLLSAAFRNLITNSQTGKLMALSLEVVVYRSDSEQRLPPLAGGSWRYIWKSAADTFHTAIHSLAASRVPVEKLTIFNDRPLQRCSLACNELGSIDFDNEGLAISLASLKSLSLSFSDRIIFNSENDAKQSYDPDEDTNWDEVGEGRDENDIRAEAANERNFIGLGKLLKLCDQLEELNLHQYLLSRSRISPNEMFRERLLQRAAEIIQNMHLKRMELRGLYVRGEDLLAFLQQTAVRKLYMEGLSVISGSFQPVFSYCSSDAAVLEELYCDELVEQGLRVYFDGHGSYRFPPLTGPGGCDRLIRKGAELKRPIVYRAAQSVGVGSPETAEYVRNRYREYGPPQKGTA